MWCVTPLAWFSSSTGWEQRERLISHHQYGKEKYLVHEILHESLAPTTNTRMSLLPTTTVLRKRLPHTLQKCSTFELLSACLWKCRTVALDLDDPNEVVGLSCFITAHGKVKVPNGYYGNAFVFPTALSKAALLCRNPLGYALGLIREAKGRMNEEYVRSVVDLMVLKGRPMHRKGWNFFVGDLTRVGFERVDFGWGKPIYGGPVGAIPFISYLARFRNCRGEDGIVVPILLPQLVMERFLLELKKITTDDDDEDQDLNNIHHRKNKTGTKARSML